MTEQQATAILRAIELAAWPDSAKPDWPWTTEAMRFHKVLPVGLVNLVEIYTASALKHTDLARAIDMTEEG